jgi:hypothetical protein
MQWEETTDEAYSTPLGRGGKREGVDFELEGESKFKEPRRAERERERIRSGMKEGKKRIRKKVAHM